MIDLETRLAEIGDHLAIDESDELVHDVLARLDEPTTERVDVADRSVVRQRRGSTIWLRAAAVVLVIAAALAAVPASRDAIADWFGLDGVEIDRQPELSVPAAAPPISGDPLGTVVEVADASDQGTGDEVADAANQVMAIDVAEFEGHLDDVFLTKTLATGTDIERVEVAGAPGLWIDGDPHLVTYRAPDDEIVTERFAGNTLLWQDGDVIRRVEGFATAAEAIAYAER